MPFLIPDVLRAWPSNPLNEDTKCGDKFKTDKKQGPRAKTSVSFPSTDDRPSQRPCHLSPEKTLSALRTSGGGISPRSNDSACRARSFFQRSCLPDVVMISSLPRS